MRRGFLLVVAFMVAGMGVATGAPPSQFAVVDDIRIHYLDFGTGSPVLFLHGAFGSTRLWLPAGERLAACHRVIIPDLRGRGLTPDGDGAITAGRGARDMIGLLDQLGVRRAHIVGHSAGSLVALAMAVDYPERVASATLVGSPATLLEQVTVPIAELRADLVRLRDGLQPADAFLASFRDLWLRTAPEPQRFRVMIGKLLDGTATLYPLQTYASAPAPKFVVIAGRDELIDQESFVELARVLHAARTADYPEATHRLPLEETVRIASDIVAFVDFVDGRRCNGSSQ